MKMSKADVILHPVRMRIIQSLLKRPLTTQQLLEWLPDIPQATLYRQLKFLVENDLIVVTAERKVRGAIEKTYTLQTELVNISAADLNELSKEEHLEYFMTYSANLMKNVEDYLSSPNVNMENDGFGYRQVELYLDNKEFTNFKNDLREVIQKYASNEPNNDRRRRTVATTVIPERK